MTVILYHLVGGSQALAQLIPVSASKGIWWRNVDLRKPGPLLMQQWNTISRTDSKSIRIIEPLAGWCQLARTKADRQSLLYMPVAGCLCQIICLSLYLWLYSIFVSSCLCVFVCVYASFWNWFSSVIQTVPAHCIIIKKSSYWDRDDGGGWPQWPSPPPTRPPLVLERIRRPVVRAFCKIWKLNVCSYSRTSAIPKQREVSNSFQHPMSSTTQTLFTEDGREPLLSH